MNKTIEEFRALATAAYDANTYQDPDKDAPWGDLVAQAVTRLKKSRLPAFAATRIEAAMQLAALANEYPPYSVSIVERQRAVASGVESGGYQHHELVSSGDHFIFPLADRQLDSYGQRDARWLRAESAVMWVATVLAVRRVEGRGLQARLMSARSASRTDGKPKPVAGFGDIPDTSAHGPLGVVIVDLTP